MNKNPNSASTSKSGNGSRCCEATMNKLVLASLALVAFMGVVVPAKHVNVKIHQKPRQINVPINFKNVMPLSEANANEWVDQFLAYLQPFLITQHLDPFPLFDVDAEFGFLFITARIRLTDGYLQDISTIRRNPASNATLSYEAKIITVNFDVLFKDITANYDYYATFIGLGPWGRLNARATNQEMRMGVQFDTVLNQLVLTNFELVNVGDVDIDMTGLTFIGDDLVAGFLEGVVGLFKGTIFNIIAGQIADAINNAFDAYNRGDFPIPGGF